MLCRLPLKGLPLSKEWTWTGWQGGGEAVRGGMGGRMAAGMQNELKIKKGLSSKNKKREKLRMDFEDLFSHLKISSCYVRIQKCLTS